MSPRFRERVVPPWWALLLPLLALPAAVIVFLPIEPVWGWVIGAVLVVALIVALWMTSPVVEVTSGHLRAGRARIPVRVLGPVEVLDAAAVRTALHVGYDAAAYTCTTPWVATAVRARVDDASDPTSAWLVSSRRGEELAAAVDAERSSASGLD